MLGPDAFDPYTGFPLAQDFRVDSLQPFIGDTTPDSLSAFDEMYTGRVIGAKPTMAACMPIKDTPKMNLGAYRTDEDMAFSYFINLDDEPFTGPDLGVVYGASSAFSDAYKGSNYYANKTFFIGGKHGCPDILTPNTYDPDARPLDPTTVPLRADFRRKQAENCYDYFILNRSTNPWQNIEIPGGGTDDPLSNIDPWAAFLDSCQPLVRGDEAENIKFAGWMKDPNVSQIEKRAGFSPVWKSWRPDENEAEYLISSYLHSAWYVNFIANPLLKPEAERPPIPDNPYATFAVSLPCIEETNSPFPAGGGGFRPPRWLPPDPTSPVCNPATPYPSPSPSPCGPPYFALPPDDWGNPPALKQDYCPNVEKIVEPRSPFTPRWDIQNLARPGYLIDRAYSNETSRCIPEDLCEPESPQHRGYTTYVGGGVPTFCHNDPWGAEGTPITTSPYYDPSTGGAHQTNNILFPPVICAVVPVDILSFRSRAFDSCIMQRINHNYNDWILNGFLDPYEMSEDPGGWWVAPCSTRFYENDSGVCPTRMSIQQCCRILVKDLVPANFLKMRIEEGLVETRKLYYEFGFFVDDNALFADIFGTYDALVNITDDSYFWIDEDAYRWAIKDNMTLNQLRGDNTEPAEYHFTYWGVQGYSAPDLYDCDPTGLFCPMKFVGYHMPYMRWWDTGVSAGNPRHGGSFLNTLGAYDTIIGVGREERDFYDSRVEWMQARDWAELLDDFSMDSSEAWNAYSELHNIQKSQMGRIGGWAELKAHQMWSIRRSNLFCVGRYEKLFKATGPEDLVLSKAGASYNKVAGGSNPWNLGWRGYISDSRGRNQFVQNVFDETTDYGFYGLDNALPGDIIIYSVGPYDPMPRIAYVTAASSSDPRMATARWDYTLNKNVAADGTVLTPDYVNIVTFDQGKFPTATGMSIASGMGPQRTIYKMFVPDTYRDEICIDKALRAITDTRPGERGCREPFPPNLCTVMGSDGKGCQPSCEDPSYKFCVLEPKDGAIKFLPGGGTTVGKLGWEAVQIYRPSRDVRRCPFGVVPATDPAFGTFHLPTTYDWTGWTGNPDVLPNRTVSGFVPDNGAGHPASDIDYVVFQDKTEWIWSNIWATCVNFGFDPPIHFNKEYSGSQTGAVTDLTHCGPAWAECSSASGAVDRIFAPNTLMQGVPR